MENERLKKQLDFILKIDEEKNILRQTHLSHHGRRENDAEHAWHMSIMAYLLKEYANEEVDIARVMLMCLIHDIVEIEAGDTYAYDEEGKKTQAEREEKAAQNLFGMLPDDQRDLLYELFHEFDDGKTADAKYARTMDNLQPLILNNSNGGEDWRKRGIERVAVEKRQGRSKEGSEVLYAYTEEIIEENARKGNLKE